MRSLLRKTVPYFLGKRRVGADVFTDGDRLVSALVVQGVDTAGDELAVRLRGRVTTSENTAKSELQHTVWFLQCTCTL